MKKYTIKRIDLTKPAVQEKLMEDLDLSPLDEPGYFQFTIPAPEGSKFTKEALDGQVGRATSIPGKEGTFTITAVEVMEGGDVGLITIRKNDNGDD